MLSGKDGHVHGAVLAVASRSGHPMTLQRPLQLLYPLAFNHCGDTEVVSQLNEQHSQTEDIVVMSRMNQQSILTMILRSPQHQLKGDVLPWSSR